MKKQDYTAAIAANITADAAFKGITYVSAWWSENFEGSSEKEGDVFTIAFNETTFVDFKVIEAVAGKKMAWLVTDCNLPWLADKKEWNGTKMIFEIIPGHNETQINFTHIGLVPEVECYDGCVKGWDQYIKDSLFKLLTEGKGQPQKRKLETA